MLELQKVYSQNPNLPFYIICTISRSFDPYHLKNQKTHLIFSTFYTYENRIPFFIQKEVLKNLLVLTITSNDILDVNCQIREKSNILEMLIPYFYIVKGSEPPVNSSFSKALTSIFGDSATFQKVYPDYETDLNMHYSYQNILLVFESLSWSNIQLLFKSFNISVSGGSNSKRHMLSTSEYLLTKNLITMGYTYHDVWKSKQLEKELKDRDMVDPRN